MTEFHFKSNGKYIVNVENGYLRWTRKGLQNFLTQGSKGEKSIPIKSITAVQIKEPRITTGYIQFAYSGSSESKGGAISAVKDENSILFAKKELEKAKELKQLIETIQSEVNDSKAEISVSGADELTKYKQLMDDGVITQEEFEAKKKQILGI